MTNEEIIENLKKENRRLERMVREMDCLYAREKANAASAEAQVIEKSFEIWKLKNPDKDEPGFFTMSPEMAQYLDQKAKGL